MGALLMFSKLLIANRGEIACRIIRTCRRLGIATVAVCSDADRDALHVRLADEAVRLGPAPAAESYLLADKVLEAARRTGAAAIHPGYGFLSENAAFAAAVREAGLVFVGPSAEAMELMGAKDRAKAVMQRAGVPVVPGYAGDDQDDGRLAQEAERTGFPLLLKAAAGGGGKGMRRVDGPAGFMDALAACRREARAAFGDERMLIERLIASPRHVELQVMADRHGNAVHLFERDCTLQRRHQKVIEEAPAAGLDPAIRQALGEAAVQAALASGYENAGTVEFLLEPSGSFYFIEMNTRLQVEHPVTEAITGLDLVEWQLRIAAGQPLPLRQEEIRAQGHAFEARLYAEDPARGFLPSTGRLAALRLPFGLPGARVETGVEEGDAVTPFYDPMIAKIVVHGPDRARALDLLAQALDATAVSGPATNLAFLRRVCTAPSFRELSIDTSWLDREGAALAGATAPVEPEHVLMAAMAVLQRRCRQASGTSPWDDPGGWRLNAPPTHTVRLLRDGHEHVVHVAGTAEGGTALLGEQAVALRAGADTRGPWIELDGWRRRFAATWAGEELVLVAGGRRLRFLLEAGTGLVAGEEAAQGLLAAPMPGRVTRVLVAEGEAVEAGQPLAILEAMKMEHRFEAPVAGRVAAVHVREGEQVEEGAILLDLVREEGA
ncbi:biotin carboxylase N-terminal domain-containing protein [Geminicoccaceae bacterium 1502E]|nr:biotin carboxylase N-terminal domain-containing protein [Geminicoccaceae bacterium 1502E]